MIKRSRFLNPQEFVIAAKKVGRYFEPKHAEIEWDWEEDSYILKPYKFREEREKLLPSVRSC